MNGTHQNSGTLDLPQPQKQDLAEPFDRAAQRNGSLKADSQAQNALLQCCIFLARAMGSELRVPSDGASALGLPELCAVNGLRHRKVLLPENWWKSDNGPLLGFRLPLQSGFPAAPVVLLPGHGKYQLVDPESNTRKWVDARTAATLQSAAFVLYRPLPARPLKMLDLMRAGLRGTGRDAVTLTGGVLCSGLVALLAPIITRRIINSTLPRSNHMELLYMALALVISAAAAATLEFARGLTLVRVKSRTAISLQAALWNRLLALPVAFFRNFTVGDLAVRSMGFDSIQQLLTTDITSALFSVFSGLFSLAILFFYSRALAFVAIASVIVLAVFTTYLALEQLGHLRMLQRVNGKLASLVYALLNGIAKLRVGAGERRAFVKWAHLFNEQRHHSLAIQRLAIIQSIIGLVFGIGMPISLLAMVALSAKLRIGVGEYLAFNAAFGQFQSSALAAISAIPALLSFVPAYERMQPILEAVTESHPGQVSPGPLRGMIEFRHVSFRYKDGPLVLTDVSLSARPGEFVAIVGPSGSGKSTCLRLMLGFEHPEAGSVLIDGQSVDILNMYLVRRETGVVLQSSRPLVGDIFHNIIGSLSLTIDDAWWAARYVGLEEEIRSLPMGMFTHVNQRGVSFSGGQRQRLLLARALVSRPRILLLDEATSALDNLTQAHIARNLADLGVTRIVVAHRLSTIRHASHIYVLNQGRVIEHGGFDTLMKQNGLFASMAKRQLVDT